MRNYSNSLHLIARVFGDQWMAAFTNWTTHQQIDTLLVHITTESDKRKKKQSSDTKKELGLSYIYCKYVVFLYIYGNESLQNNFS